ncbi:hypothetical protein V8C35DRAFT_314561 [Trichoderma chlorosporum]
MPTLRERKNASSGTKVRLTSHQSGSLASPHISANYTKVHASKDDPVHREGAGIVASESLAAESIQHGGEFAQNRNVQPEVMSGSDLESQSRREGGSAVEAPGYAADQDIKDTKGPHGKGIKKGVGEESGVRNDGLERALRSEPGSEDDPSRLAEAQMLQRDSLGGGGAGPRQSRLDTESKYDALKNEVPS